LIVLCVIDAAAVCKIGLQQQHQHLLLSGLWNCRFFKRLNKPEHLQNSEKFGCWQLEGKTHMESYKRKQACQGRMQTAVGHRTTKYTLVKKRTAMAPTPFSSTLLFIGKLSPATTCAIIPPNVMAPSNSLHAKRFTNVRYRWSSSSMVCSRLRRISKIGPFVRHY
jgi:hypothetical protein